MAKQKLPITDPAEIANARILAARQERIIQAEVDSTMDLGLDLTEPPIESADAFLRDEWDKKAFGDAPKTTTRVVYGPDPIVTNCPEFHERLEKYGLETIAESFYKLIMAKGELACPDAVMRKGVRASIEKFGKEATAKAFQDRILRIPQRTVEIEIDGALDPLLVNPMRGAVDKYGRPGYSNKFLSERCMDVLGMRGYQLVKQPNGDPVKIGTLFMGEIPTEWAERRLLHFANESRTALAEQESNYYENAKRQIDSEGGRATGATILKRGDSINADPALNDDYSGESRATGISMGRGRE